MAIYVKKIYHKQKKWIQHEVVSIFLISKNYLIFGYINSNWFLSIDCTCNNLFR